MIIYVTHSYNYKDEVNKRIYSICGLIVNDDLNMKLIDKELRKKIQSKKLKNANSLCETLDSKVLDTDRYAVDIKKYLLVEMSKYAQIVAYSTEIKDELSEEKMVEKYFYELLCKILLEKNFVEKVTSIKVFNIIERDDLKSKIMQDFSIEIDFHDRNNSLGLKFSDNFCSIIRKNHSNLDNVKDFYTLITKNCNNIIDEMIELL